MIYQQGLIVKECITPEIDRGFMTWNSYNLGGFFEEKYKQYDCKVLYLLRMRKEITVIHEFESQQTHVSQISEKYILFIFLYLF